MIGLRTNPACRTPPPLPAPGARQREREAEEAGWEARLRRLPKHGTRHADAVAPRGNAPRRTLLEPAGRPGRHDMLLLPRAVPIATGAEPEDLVCGSCAAIVAAWTSRASLRRLYPEGDRLILRCPCRTLNLLSGLAGPRSSYRRT